MSTYSERTDDMTELTVEQILRVQPLEAVEDPARQVTADVHSRLHVPKAMLDAIRHFS